MAYNKSQGKSKFEPYYLSITVIVFVSFFVGYLLKKVLFKFKSKSNLQSHCNPSFSTEEFLNEELKNEEKNKENYEKKKKQKPRVKALTKATGFIPEEHKFKSKKIEEKSAKQDENKILNDSESKELISSPKLEKENTKDESVEQVTEKNSIKSFKKNPSSEGKGTKDIKKSNFLNDFEKDSLTPRVKEDSIYSIKEEYKSKEKIHLSDKINNSKLILQCKNVTDQKSLQKVLDLYIETQKKSIIIKESLVALIETSLMLEEVNHAAFFLTEMDNYNYPIPRRILELFMDLQITQLTLKNELKQKASKKKEVNKFDKYSKNLIKPLTDNFINSPDYFYFNSKTLSYKTLNIENTLKSLSLNSSSKPFFPREKKEEINSEPKEIDVKKELSLNEKKETKQVENVSEEKAKDKGNNNKNNVEDINKKIEIKLKDLNFADIKEFYPKNFKILHKNK